MRLTGPRAVLAAIAVALAAGGFSATAQVAASPGDLPEPRLSLVVSREEGVVISVRAVGAATDAQRSPADRGQDSSPPDPFSGRGDAGAGPGVPDRSLASGVIIDSEGYALTNAHAVVGAAQLRIRLASGREASARVLGYDLRTDIALLRLDVRGVPAARLGDPAELSVGDGVFAIGAPFGLERSVTAGIVSAKPRYLPGGGGLPMIQTDVAINPGSSGSPLFNLRGELVGINSMMMSSSGGYDGVSLALPIDVAMQVADELRDHGYVRRSRLGARLQEVTAGTGPLLSGSHRRAGR
jgi:serine protease Do